MCPDALLLLLKVFCGFFFLTPQPGLTTQSPTMVLTEQNEFVYSAALSLSSRCVIVCDELGSREAF